MNTLNYEDKSIDIRELLSDSGLFGFDEVDSMYTRNVDGMKKDIVTQGENDGEWEVFIADKYFRHQIKLTDDMSGSAQDFAKKITTIIG